MLFLLVGVLLLSLSFLYDYLVSRYPLIDPSWKTTELNLSLKKEYGLELPIFAYILAEAFMDRLWPDSSFLGRTRTSIKDEMVYVDKLRHKLLSSLSRYCRCFPVSESYEGLSNEEERRSHLIENFCLNPFFVFLELRVRQLEEILKMLPERKKGLSIRTRAQVILVWASLMQRKGIIHWSNIARLFKCFSDRLEGAEYVADVYTTNNFKKESKWIRNAYNSNLKVIRKSRKSERAKQKRFKNFQSYVAAMRLFRSDRLPNIFCIEFNKDSIEVKERGDNNFWALGVRFIKGKKYPYVSNPLSDFSPKEPRSIIFPKKEV